MHRRGDLHLRRLELCRLCVGPPHVALRFDFHHAFPKPCVIKIEYIFPVAKCIYVSSMLSSASLSSLQILTALFNTANVHQVFHLFDSVACPSLGSMRTTGWNR